jgi:hypothetical protein
MIGKLFHIGKRWSLTFQCVSWAARVYSLTSPSVQVTLAKARWVSTNLAILSML